MDTGKQRRVLQASVQSRERIPVPFVPLQTGGWVRTRIGVQLSSVPSGSLLDARRTQHLHQCRPTTSRRRETHRHLR